MGVNGYKEHCFNSMKQHVLPLLGRFIVSISTPDSLAFFIADEARGQPDRLKEIKTKPHKHNHITVAALDP